jgi:hypothetical protein
MEQQFNFQQNMDFQVQDFIDLQQWTSDAIDHVALDALAPGGMFYTGLAATQNGQTQVNVAAGRLYSQGTNPSGSAGLWVYQYPTPSTNSLQSMLPLSNPKLVALIAWGSVNPDADVEPRSFLVNAQTGQAQTQSTALQTTRVCNLQFVAGVESPVPQLPTIPANALLIATITLSPTGITSVAMQTGNVLPNLASHEKRVTALESTSSQVQLQTASLGTDLSALATKTNALAPMSLVTQMAADLAKAKLMLHLPSSYSSYETDHFGNATLSNPAANNYAAKLNNGLLFPDAANGTFPLDLFNPIDASVIKSTRGLILPTFTSVPRIQTKGYSGDLSLSQYQVQTQTLVPYQETVWQYRYGWNWNYYNAWYQGQFWNFYNQYYAYNLLGGYWYAYTQTGYTVQTSTTSINGAMVAQTFLASNAMWLTGVDLYLTSVGASGDITLAIAKTVAGQPDLSNTIAIVTVPVASLQTYPAATNIPIPPVLLEAGTRYALVLITQGNHRVAVVSGNNFTNGTIFYSTDGAYFTGDLTKDLMFTLYGAQFASALTQVQLQPVSLAGGLTDLAVNVAQVVPQGAALQFQFQVNGTWYNLGDATAPLDTAPQLVPLRAVFLGTSDLAPAVIASATGVVASRPATAFNHTSEVRTLSSGSKNIQVQVVAVNYNAAVHTLACSITSGGTTTTPSLTSSQLEPDGAGLRFTFAFSLTADISTYAINIQGTRQAAAAPFQIVERTDVAQ